MSHFRNEKLTKKNEIIAQLCENIGVDWCQKQVKNELDFQMFCVRIKFTG